HWVAFGLHDGVFEAGGNSDPLTPACLISDHTTACRLSHRHSMQHLAGGCVERQEVAIESCSKYEPGSGDGDTGNHRLWSFTAPSHYARISIDGCDPSFFAIVFVPKSVCGTEKLFAGLERGSLRIEL